MKQAKHIATQDFQKAGRPEQAGYTEKDRQIVKKLFSAMQTNYGALFMANLDSEKDQELWERSWMASITGKSPEYVAKALTHCLDTHPKPFTRADFQMAYKSIRPGPANRRNQLALPKRTKEESRAIAEKHIEDVRGLIRGIT